MKLGDVAIITAATNGWIGTSLAQVDIGVENSTFVEETPSPEGFVIPAAHESDDFLSH